MAPTKTRTGLLRRRNALLAELAAKEPVLSANLNAVLTELDQPDFVAAGEYALVDKPYDAIVMYLKKTGNWTDKTAIGKAVMEGGYREDPVKGVAYLVSTINYSVKRKKLQLVDGLVGLPDWLPPPQS